MAVNNRTRITTLVPFILLSASLAVAQSSYTDWVNCVKSSTNGSWGTTCTLPGNQNYYLTTDGTAGTASIIPLIVGRAPLTIQGSGANSMLTRRAYTSAVAAPTLIEVPATVAVPTGSGPFTITIQNIMINGNRAQQCSSTYGCIVYPSIGNPANGNGLGGFASHFYEIRLDYSTQPVPVSISGLTMFDAPGYGIFIARGKFVSGGSPYNVRINHSTFGVQSGTYANHGCAYLSCIMSWTNNSATMPYNPVILNSTFYGAGGGAVAFNNAVYPQVYTNTFFDNMREVPWCPYAGGQAIYIGWASGALNSTAAVIYNNTLNGNLEQNNTCANGAKGGGGSGGLELQGANHLIQMNTLQNHRGDGISLEGVQCAHLVSNTITNNGGDSLYAHYDIVVKSDSPFPQSSDIRLDTNSVHNNAVPGFWAWMLGDGVTRIDYAANTGNSSYFYSNTGGNVGSGSAASTAWTPANCSIPGI